MRSFSFFVLVSLCTAFTACNSTKTAVSANDGKHFGESINAKGAISYDKLLSNLQDKKSLDAKVEGTVEGVCQAKGCWMTIVSTDANKPKMMVKFKDYGFFMPKDIMGRKVVMQGTAFREVTTVEDLRHYAEDAGKSAAEIATITKPKEELKFLASGVLLLD
jgi:Domain of unknown function (DUF4920)